MHAGKENSGVKRNGNTSVMNVRRGTLRRRIHNEFILVPDLITPAMQLIQQLTRRAMVIFIIHSVHGVF